MIHYDVAKKFSRLPGGRKIEHGNHSGEQFLLEVLVPFWELWNNEQERIEIDFSGCRGVAHTFLDESFGELASIYGVDAVGIRFRVTGAGVEDVIDEILERGEKSGKVLTPELNKVKVTRAHREHVQDFMEWCAEQDPPLRLCQALYEGEVSGDFRDVDWKKYCTKWCEVDEDKMEQEKLQILAKQREMNDLFERSKKHCSGRKSRL